MESNDSPIGDPQDTLEANWPFTAFDERMRQEIMFNLVYDSSVFRHGTDGHNSRIIIARLAVVATQLEREVKALRTQLGSQLDNV